MASAAGKRICGLLLHNGKMFPENQIQNFWEIHSLIACKKMGDLYPRCFDFLLSG
jgi:hypothetical protein